MDTKFFKSPVGALGWTWGIICLFVVGLFSAYANWLSAAFHFIDAMVRGSLDTEILWAFFLVALQGPVCVWKSFQVAELLGGRL